MRVHKASIQPGGEVEMMQTESLSGLAQIAKMVSDDNEAKAVTSKLLMLAEGTPSDDLLPFIQKLKKQLQPWHDKATETLKAAIKEIESCTAEMENGMHETEPEKGICSVKGTSHTTQRTDESAKCTSKEQAKADKAEKKEEMITECNAFKAVKDEVHSTTASYGGGDEGAYLESVSQQFCSGLLPRFKAAKEKCTTATAEHTKASEIYETKNTAYTVQKSASDTVQTEMDVTCCEYALATKSVCTSGDTCYEDKVEAYKAVEAIIKGEEKVKKVEWRVYSRIECLLPVLGTDNAAKIDECRAKEHSTSHLDIEYPKIPEKSECTPEQDFPGTEAYKNAHFDNLPDNAKGKDVAVCAGMNAVSISVARHVARAAKAGCRDIEYKMKDIWNYKGSGVALGKYTNNELQFIGCVGNGCSASTFYCKDGPDGITFGTTQRSAMRACAGVSRLEDCKYNGCCKKAGGLCNSPDKTVDATKLCQQLGYGTGTVEMIPDNSCPEAGWMGGQWSSDYVNSRGYGKTYTCSV